jgi:hypothetical protein
MKGDEMIARRERHPGEGYTTNSLVRKPAMETQMESELSW